MIVLDTHIWVWWVQGDERLTATQWQAIEGNESDALGVSAISCWEIAKLVERGRLMLPVPLAEWFTQALSYPGVQLLPSPRRLPLPRRHFQAHSIATQPIS